jgi:serralysin
MLLEQFGLVNVPLKYNPTIEFIDSLIITDRNGSALIRTWAGNDKFTDKNVNSAPTHIDGGLGVDTSSYSMPSSFYQITSKNDGGINVSGPKILDTLINIERLQFSDKTIAMDINGSAGQVYRLYQAAFDRLPDKDGMGDWIYGMDHGMTLLEVSADFVDSNEFKSVYGLNPTNSEVVTRFYKNVLHRDPEQAGFDYWINQIVSGSQTRTQVLTGFSESPENQLQVIGVIQNGIEYTAHLI